MKYLFSECGIRLLESFCFTNTLFAFDFDGTLAKIVQTPSEAKMTRETTQLLETLNRYVPVAVISGRKIQDLKLRMNFQPTFLVGNHGLEGPISTKFSEIELKEMCYFWANQLSQKLSTSFFDSGVEIEDKTYSLAIHYRKSRNKANVRTVLSKVLSELQPSPRIILGKAVFNIVPAGAPHKGIALLELMEQTNTRTAFYIGDDDTDEDVFSLSDSKVLTVRVGRNRNSQARFFIQKQSEINRILRDLIRFIALNSQEPMRQIQC